jgi:hypothetical protein
MVFDIKKNNIMKNRMTSRTLRNIQLEINRLAFGTMTGNIPINQTMLPDSLDIQLLEYADESRGHKGGIISQNH